MNTYLSTLAVIGLLLVLMVLLWKGGRRQRVEASPQAAKPATHSASSGRWRWFSLRRQPAPQQKFGLWASQALVGLPELSDWLVQLPAAEYTRLYNDLAQFCEGLGIELAWLYAPPPTLSQALQRRLQQVVTSYLQARCYGALAHDDILAFRAYSAYCRKPSDAQQQAFAQKLFDQLLSQGLTPLVTAELVMAKAQARQRYIVKAIAQAAEQHPDAFAAALRSAVQPPAVAGEAPKPV